MTKIVDFTSTRIFDFERHFSPTQLFEDTQPGGECFAPCRRDTGTSMAGRVVSWAGFGKVQWAQESAKMVEIRSQNTNFTKSRKLRQGDSGVVKCLPGWPGDAPGSPGVTLTKFQKFDFSTQVATQMARAPAYFEFSRRRQYFSRLPTSPFEFSKGESTAAIVGDQ